MSALFSRHRFVRTCSRCSRPPICSPPRRIAFRPARRSTRRSTIPTNFFTAQGLDNRASDINNLLDGIGNGVQVLQAANTGITSLQKLVDTAKSLANQALQTTVGYSTKSNVSTTIAGATATDLRGTTTFTKRVGDQQRRRQRHRRWRFPVECDHARRHGPLRLALRQRRLADGCRPCCGTLTADRFERAPRRSSGPGHGR